VRLRTLNVAVCSSLMALACASLPAGALANTSVAGGAAPASTPVNTTVAGGAAPTAPTPVKPAHHAPITAPTPNIAYSGPVYEKTAAGQLVPYTPPAAPATTTGEASSATAHTTTAGSAPAGASATTGGSPVTPATPATPATGPTLSTPELLVPGHTARIIDGFAAAPMDAPPAVQQIIWAGNQIVGLPYIYGGGHASFVSPGYDCSGTVSYALHGASLLATPMDSGEFESWDGHGVGTWVTIFANGGHAYMTVAGIRLDTSPANDPSGLQGPRWRPLRPENAGFVVRHPTGL
jgi:cell wall-associated NlpC family hydrolase